MQPQANIRTTSTGSLSIADRFPYWADVVTQTFVALECDTPDKQRFAGTIRHRSIGCIGIADVCATAQRARRTVSAIATAPSDDLIVVLHLQGPCRVGQNVNVAELNPGEGVSVAADESYFFEFPQPFRQIVLKMPASLLRAGQAPLVRKPAFHLGAGPGKLLRHLALSVLDDPAYVSGEEEFGIERAFAELLRSATLVERDEGSADRPTRYAAALSFIKRHLSDPTLNPDAVAAHLGISRRSLARDFAGRGATVERAIWSARLDAAKRDLADPRLRAASITQIAFSWAFNDTAHFSRSFSQAYGMTPKRFRDISLRSS